MHHHSDGRRSKSIWAHEPILTPERKHLGGAASD